MSERIFQNILELCKHNTDDYKAHQMEAYMKNLFRFYGISQPLRKTILSEIKKSFVIEWNDDTKILIEKLWQGEKREMQYFAIDIMKPMTKKMSLNDLDWVESLIVTQSWWDSVDFLATHCVGRILSNVEDKETYAMSRIENDNMWLQRTALLFQLKYKDKTQWDLLQSLILMTESSTEFFIRKAQGWALREYSKTHPLDVRIFVENNPQLSGLTKREALKYV